MREKRVEEALAIIEVRSLQPRKGRGEINEALARRKIKQAQSARDGKTLSAGRRHSVSIVHQKEVRPDHRGKRDGFAFASVERREVNRGLSGFDRTDFKPGLRRGNSGANHIRSVGMGKFVARALRRQNLFKHVWQNCDVARRHKIMKRPRIGDGKPHVALKAESLQVGPILLKVAFAVATYDAMVDQECVKFAARRQTQYALQFRAS